MAALTGGKEVVRQPSEYVAYTGNSGVNYYAGGMLLKSGISAGLIVPVPSTGTTLGTFLGVLDNNSFPSTGISNAPLKTWKTGEFTFDAQGTGVSADIGKVAYALNDNTVGVSAAQTRVKVGVITGVPTSTTYRVRITNYTDTIAE